MWPFSYGGYFFPTFAYFCLLLLTFERQQKAGKRQEKEQPQKKKEQPQKEKNRKRTEKKKTRAPGRSTPRSDIPAVYKVNRQDKTRFYPGFCPELPFFWVLVPGSNPGFSLGDFFREWPKGGTKGVLLPDRVFFTFSWVSADPEPNPVPGRISTPVPNPGFEPRFGPGSGRSGFWFPLRRKPGSPENPEGGR